MLGVALMLIVFSVTLQLPGNSALNNNEIIGRSRRQDFTNLNPFNSNWFKRAICASDATSGNRIGKRSRFPNTFEYSNEIEDDWDNEVTSGRFFPKLPCKINWRRDFFRRVRNTVNPLSNFMPCRSSQENLMSETGVCLLPPVCSFYGGRATTGGRCRMGLSCCVNEIPNCGQLVTFNNTYWQSPSFINSESSCNLTIKLDHHLVEQSKPICQIRLDFLTFSLAQPNANTVCDVDHFQVTGATNKIPVICGENHGQHMYLMIPRVSNQVELLMTLGTSTVHRIWRIKIAMLSCDSEYLAPEGCLQYFTSSVGSVMTFNWKDTSSRTTRQLANQDYYMCFRKELVQRQASPQIATTLCLSQCQVTSGLPFSVSGNLAETSQASGALSCSNDYIVFPGGYSWPPTTPLNQRDRYCGTLLSQVDEGIEPQTICSTAKPFRLLYRTNGDDTLSIPMDSTLIGNQGFCLNFEQKLT
ncbi:uncharacterized protein LOC124205581 [Daphnia pulex]|uniref:uncharacterized protein LOC124205581 n=1 Tax=Daphnia pulex TaxID=6669 RepID=UPI001EE1138B|nr:uncharacterized protein LOC124205581 [Daphnia pulex]